MVFSPSFGGGINTFFSRKFTVLHCYNKKDHVTLKTGVMAAENPALPSQD